MHPSLSRDPVTTTYLPSLSALRTPSSPTPPPPPQPEISQPSTLVNSNGSGSNDGNDMNNRAPYRLVYTPEQQRSAHHANANGTAPHHHHHSNPYFYPQDYASHSAPEPTTTYPYAPPNPNPQQQPAPNHTCLVDEKGLPRLGKTRCYWALLSCDLRFIFLDPVLSTHMRAEAQLLLGHHVLEFVHPGDREKAGEDLEEVTKTRTIFGTVTRLRYLRANRVRVALGCSTPDVEPEAHKYCLDENYLICDLVLSYVGEGLLLCFFHAIVDKDPALDSNESQKSEWTNWCGSPPVLPQHCSNLYTSLMPFAPHIDKHPSRVFQILAASDRSRLFSWPLQGYDTEKYTDLGQHVNLGECMGLERQATSSCTRRYTTTSRAKLVELDADIESVYIPYGSVIFACHRTSFPLPGPPLLDPLSSIPYPHPNSTTYFTPSANPYAGRIGPPLPQYPPPPAQAVAAAATQNHNHSHSHSYDNTHHQHSHIYTGAQAEPGSSAVASSYGVPYAVNNGNGNSGSPAGTGPGYYPPSDVRHTSAFPALPPLSTLPDPRTSNSNSFPTLRPPTSTLPDGARNPNALLTLPPPSHIYDPRTANSNGAVPILFSPPFWRQQEQQAQAQQARTEQQQQQQAHLPSPPDSTARPTPSSGSSVMAYPPHHASVSPVATTRAHHHHSGPSNGAHGSAYPHQHQQHPAPHPRQSLPYPLSQPRPQQPTVQQPTPISAPVGSAAPRGSYFFPRTEAPAPHPRRPAHKHAHPTPPSPSHRSLSPTSSQDASRESTPGASAARASETFPGHTQPTFQSSTRKSGAPPPGVNKCFQCPCVESPEWRKGPRGIKDLCNACGLRYARLNAKEQGISPQKRKRENNGRDDDDGGCGRKRAPAKRPRKAPPLSKAAKAKAAREEAKRDQEAAAAAQLAAEKSDEDSDDDLVQMKDLVKREPPMLVSQDSERSAIGHAYPYAESVRSGSETAGPAVPVARLLHP